MGSSLFDLDKTTHAKIVFVALSAVAVLIAIGLNAQIDRTAAVSRQPTGYRVPAPVPVPEELEPVKPSNSVSVALG